MPVYTETKTYHTKAHMGMIDVTDDFRAAVQNACRKTGMKSGTITGFTTGGVAGLTTLEFEPGMYRHPARRNPGRAFQRAADRVSCTRY